MIAQMEPEQMIKRQPLRHQFNEIQKNVITKHKSIITQNIHQPKVIH